MASAGGARGERSEPSLCLLPAACWWLYVALCGFMWLMVDIVPIMASAGGARGERSEPSLCLPPGGFMWLYVALCGSMWLYVAHGGYGADNGQK